MQISHQQQLQLQQQKAQTRNALCGHSGWGIASPSQPPHSAMEGERIIDAFRAATSFARPLICYRIALN